MDRHNSLLILTLAFILWGNCEAQDREVPSDSLDANGAQISPFLYVWARDEDQSHGGTDFLATINADPSSAGYGEILATTPIHRMGTGAHHAEPVAPTEGPLLASGFSIDRTYMFDLTIPNAPKLIGELDTIPGLSYTHDYRRLPDGKILMTMQRGDGSQEGDPGGLALLESDGTLLLTASAADPAFPGAIIRPYSLDVAAKRDRVLTTGRSMFYSEERAADVIQVWRLSDLKLLKTLSVLPIEEPMAPACVLRPDELCEATHYSSEQEPFEIRTMTDGSALLSTFTCGIYRIPDITSDVPTLEPVLNYPDLLGCSVPSLIGDYLLLPVMFSRTILTLDISDPAVPREVSRYDTPNDFLPHWSAADPKANRIVVTPDGNESTFSVAIFHVDRETGSLELDRRFGGEKPPLGLSFELTHWPHGSTGPADPHAALFGQ